VGYVDLLSLKLSTENQETICSLTKKCANEESTLAQLGLMVPGDEKLFTAVIGSPVAVARLRFESQK